MKTGKVCELCTEDASLYCVADAAFLCFHCDARVHQANFLVARHVREVLCSKCKSSIGDRISGSGTRILHYICQSCLPEELSGEVDSLSSSSACVSSTESCATSSKKISFKDQRMKKDILKRKSLTEIPSRDSNALPRFSGSAKKKIRSMLPSDLKVEGIFVNWCKKLRVNGNLAVPLAAKVMRFCLSRSTALPFKVSLAVSFWLALRFCENRSFFMSQKLRGLEEASGVPGSVILAAEARLTRTVKVKRARRDLEEGWAECSV